MLVFFCGCVILFPVMRDMTEIEKKIQKLEASIMLDPKIHNLDPIKNHRIKVRLFNIAREELLHKDLVDRCEKLTPQHLR